MSRSTCPNCTSEDLKSYELTTVETGGRTVIGCDYCVEGGVFVAGWEAERACIMCDRVTETDKETCSTECARDLAESRGRIVIDEPHESYIRRWAGESSLECSCGGWRGRHLVDLEGHRAHVRAVEAGDAEWLHVINAKSASV